MELRAGLPERARWLIRGTPLDFDFLALRSPLRPLAELVDGVAARFAELCVFGEECFAQRGGASPFLAVNSASGAIVGFDIERNLEPQFILSSNAASFVKTFVVFDRALRLGVFPVTDLAKELERIDPEGYDRSEWRDLAEAASNAALSGEEV